MRSYQADLSRRLGPVFTEQAARADSLGPYAAPFATPEGLFARWNRLRAEDTALAAPTQPVAWALHPDDATKPAPSKAYKPAHGGYPTVKAVA